MEVRFGTIPAMSSSSRLIRQEITMRLATIPATSTDAQVAPLYAAVKAALGVVPNLMQVVGNSPAALGGYLGLNGALAQGTLPAAVRERIALSVAELNGCEYCLAAHTLLGKHAGLDAAEIQRARLGTATDGYAAAAVQLARAVVQARGKVSDAELAAARRAGLDDAAIVEVVVNVALNVLTNYVNNAAQTTVDFPAAAPLASAAL
jgi:AhpD family alkylhydroperoxidase